MSASSPMATFAYTSSVNGSTRSVVSEPWGRCQLPPTWILSMTCMSLLAEPLEPHERLAGRAPGEHVVHGHGGTGQAVVHGLAVDQLAVAQPAADALLHLVEEVEA